LRERVNKLEGKRGIQPDCGLVIRTDLQPDFRARTLADKTQGMPGEGAGDAPPAEILRDGDVGNQYNLFIRLGIVDQADIGDYFSVFFPDKAIWGAGELEKCGVGIGAGGVSAHLAQNPGAFRITFQGKGIFNQVGNVVQVAFGIQAADVKKTRQEWRQASYRHSGHAA
jgi:hypothetical protein